MPGIRHSRTTLAFGFLFTALAQWAQTAHAAAFLETVVDTQHLVNPWGKAVGDLNGDGDLDAVSNGYTIDWHRNPTREGGATWIIFQTGFDVWTPVHLPQAPNGTGSAIADLDRDGRPDIVGNGFWLRQPADPANHIHRFHLADMDADGYADIVFAEQHQSPEHRVGIFRNADSLGGAWELEVISTMGSHNIATGDIGQDGDLDIFGVNWRVDTRPRLWINEAARDTAPTDTLPLPPPVPTGLSAVPGDARVALDWSRVTGASAYHLYWREGSDVDKASGTRIGGIVPPYVLDRLANGRLHAFAVSSINGDGESALSAVITATPQSPLPPSDPPLQPDPGQSPFNGAPLSLPGILQAEDFDIGAEGVAYHDLDTLNQGTHYRRTAVDIGSAARDSGGGYYVGWIGAGEWLEYTVRVDRAGPYRLESRVSSPFHNRGFHVEWNGRDITGPVRAPFSDGWHNWRTHAMDISLPDTGVGVLRVHVDSQGFNVNHLRFIDRSGG